jgi:ABC-type polysaccharide/polyol phosphate export permease
MAVGVGISEAVTGGATAPGGSGLARPWRIAFDDFRAGWGQRSLWLRLGHRELMRRYRRTILGPFWATGHIALYILFVGFIFSRVLSVTPSLYIPYLATGFMAWMLLYTVISEATTTLVQAAGVRQQVALPYSLFILAMVWRNLVVHAHNYVLYALVLLVYPIAPSWEILLLVPGYVLVLGNLVWISLLIAVLSARFRDLAQLVNSLLQILVFATPIFYRPEMLGEAQQTYLLMPNPLYHLAVVIRAPLLGEVPPVSSYIVLAAALVAGALMTAWLFGKRRHLLVFWIA